ncbi:MAG: hypothetical protein ABW250_05745 [Pyrinomonadaceae bacterium]
MSTHATAKQSEPVGEDVLPTFWVQRIISDNPVLRILNSVAFSVTNPPPRNEPGRIPISGKVDMMPPTPPIPFEGFYDAGRITYTLTLEDVPYTFDGVVSTTGTSMGGIILAPVNRIANGPDVDEDEGSWSAQARGGGEDDQHGAGKGGSKKGHK